MTFDVLNAMEGWRNGTTDNYGLILQSSQITDARRMFHLERYGAYAPYFEVTYTDSVKPKLRIIEPDSTALGECILPYLDENLPIEQINPIMPQVTCKAVFDGLSSLTTDTVDVNWEYIVEHNYWWRDITKQIANGNKYTITALDTIYRTTQISGLDTTSWLVNFADKFLGGKVSVITSAEVNGTTYSDTLKNIYEIRGTNPTPQIARDKAAFLEPNLKYNLWTIMYYESQTYTNQFIGLSPSSEVGNPLYGPPAGYGMFQLDPVEVDSTHQLWSWVGNINEGIRRFEVKVRMRDSYVDEVRNGIDIYTRWYLQYDKKDSTKVKRFHYRKYAPQGFPGATVLSTNPANDQANIVLHQLYQGHYYYIWEPDNERAHNGSGMWRVNPFLVYNDWDTGVQRNLIEKDIINGNYPPNWDSHLIGCTK